MLSLTLYAAYILFYFIFIVSLRSSLRNKMTKDFLKHRYKMSARLAGIFLDSSSEQTTRFKNTSVPKDLLYMEWTSFPGNHKKKTPMVYLVSFSVESTGTHGKKPVAHHFLCSLIWQLATFLCFSLKSSPVGWSCLDG